MIVHHSKVAKDQADKLKLAQALEDPVKMCRLCWPEIRLYDKQEEILYSLRDNVHTFVHAANEMGKDFVTSIGVVWFFASRRPARVVTSSSSETQLKNILWSEINQRLQSSRVKFPFNVSTLQIKRMLPNGLEDPLSYCLGHVTKVVENFQGHHLPHDKPRVLAVFDEASGVEDAFFEAAESWAHRILVIGNPLSTTNFFFRNCKAGDKADPAGGKGLMRKVIHIDAVNSPNYLYGEALRKLGVKGPYPSIIPGVCSHADFLRRSSSWDKVKRQMRLHGKFYEGEENLLFPPNWLDRAEEAYMALNPLGYDNYNGKLNGRTGPRYMGVDTGAGRDLTVYTIIDRLGVIHQRFEQTPNTMDIIQAVLKLKLEWNIPDGHVVFDAGGGGKQLVDRLREMGHMAIRSIPFGGSVSTQPGVKLRGKQAKINATETQQVYRNRRAQMYGLMRELINPDNEIIFGIPMELHHMREEFAILPLQYDSEGLLYLPPKDDPPKRTTSSAKSETITLKKLLGRSPDRADSLVLAVYAMHFPDMTTVLGGAL